MRIHGDQRSGNCLKVKYTAEHLALSYTWIEVDIMKGESRTPEFLAMNSAGQVPVLELEDGRCLGQSNAIMEYLSEGTDLVPEDRYERGQMRDWLYWEQYSHEPYIAVCRFQMLYLGRSADEREAWRVEKGEAALDRLEQSLRRADWLVGQRMTLADIALLAYTRMASDGGFDLGLRPAVRAWIARSERLLGVPPTPGEQG